MSFGASALPKNKQNKTKGKGMIPPKLTAVQQDPGLEEDVHAPGLTEDGTQIDASEVLAHEGWRGLPSTMLSMRR